MKWKELQDRSTSCFQRLTGVKRTTFAKMLEVVSAIPLGRPDLRGRPCLLGAEDQLLAMLMYHREYRTFFHIAADFGISEAQCWRTVRRMEDYLVGSGAFRLPGKGELKGSAGQGWEVVVVDATESPVERPKKKQRRDYSGKKKRHTIKTQLVIDGKSGRIICVAVSKGSKHDFKLYQESGLQIGAGTEVLADSGYQGLQHLHPNCTLPIKASKNRPLTNEDREHNRKLGSRRVVVEHVIGKLKVFKILALPYRNRRKRFGLRMGLIAGIYNYELL
jgi:hypothetical protein